MTDLTHLAISSPISYLIAFAVPALDAILPFLPSETLLIVLGVATAGSADPRIALLIALAACGAFAGDNLCYLIGRRFGPAAERRVFAGEKGQRRRAWANRPTRPWRAICSSWKTCSTCPPGQQTRWSGSSIIGCPAGSPWWSRRPPGRPSCRACRRDWRAG